VEEFLFSKRLDEVKENLTELFELEQVRRCICIGFCILYSFTKKLPEFKAVCQMLIGLVEDSVIQATDIEEG
jgi:hypothetical protein